jgi:hypothetical protein
MDENISMVPRLTLVLATSVICPQNWPVLATSAIRSQRSQSLPTSVKMPSHE